MFLVQTIFVLISFGYACFIIPNVLVYFSCYSGAKTETQMRELILEAYNFDIRSQFQTFIGN